MSDPVQAYAALHEQWKQENKGTFEWWLFTKVAELKLEVERLKKLAKDAESHIPERARRHNLPW